MLVISRKKDQEIVIDCIGPCRIIIRHCGGKPCNTRFGIEAPQECRVLRDDFFDKDESTGEYPAQPRPYPSNS